MEGVPAEATITLKWKFVCRDCWPSISGTGYLEDAERGKKKERAETREEECRSESPRRPNPHYIYGGTWKATIGESRGEIEGRKKVRDSTLAGA